MVRMNGKRRQNGSFRIVSVSFRFFFFFHLQRIIIVFGCNNVGTLLSISIHFQAIALCFYYKRMRISPHIHTYCEKGRLNGEENEGTKEGARRRKEDAANVVLVMVKENLSSCLYTG